MDSKGLQQLRARKADISRLLGQYRGKRDEINREIESLMADYQSVDRAITAMEKEASVSPVANPEPLFDEANKWPTSRVPGTE